MQFKYPHTIENGGTERLTFVRLTIENGSERLEVENHILPGGGPPMHVHHRQLECLTVVQGRIAVQVLGQEPEFYGEGAAVEFKAGVPHKFWNAGDTPLICKGYASPAYNLVYFLTEIYKSTKRNGGKKPGAFDAAYLLKKYGSEFDILDVPPFVKKNIFPIILFFGKLAGKHKKFAGGPETVK